MASLEEPSALEEPDPKLVAQLQSICRVQPVAKLQPLASGNWAGTALLEKPGQLEECSAVEEPRALESPSAKCARRIQWTQGLIRINCHPNFLISLPSSELPDFPSFARGLDAMRTWRSTRPLFDASAKTNAMFVNRMRLFRLACSFHSCDIPDERRVVGHLSLKLISLLCIV